jgi:hypothetical protein
MPAPPDDGRTAALVRAYLAAAYRCECDARQYDVVIGARACAIERLFPLATEFGVVSAWNPMSEPQPPAVNEAADHALRGALSQAGAAACRSLAGAPDGGWQEPGWLAAGLALPQLDVLARRFGQLGVLHWTRGQPVRLRIHHARPAGWNGPPVIDWVE